MIGWMDVCVCVCVCVFLWTCLFVWTCVCVDVSYNDGMGWTSATMMVWNKCVFLGLRYNHETDDLCGSEKKFSEIDAMTCVIVVSRV